jgi:hypothetical protein
LNDEIEINQFNKRTTKQKSTHVNL